MNYRLSCAADRVSGREGFVLECNGKELDSEIFRCVSENLKECILESIYRGIRVTRNYVNHNDIVFIEVQNVHVYEWLSGMKEYRAYSEYLDKIFEVLESMDCRYKFIFRRDLYAKKYINVKELSKMKVSSLESVMEEFE